MKASVIRLGVAMCAAVTIACGGHDQADNNSAPPATMTPGEAVGTTGTGDQAITISGCVTKVDPDGFILTSSDEGILRRETGTTGHHRDDEDSSPNEPNRSGEEERLRHLQNPSASMGRFRLVGDAESLARHAGDEVEVSGRVQHSDSENSTPATLQVETIDATGPRCGERIQ